MRRARSEEPALCGRCVWPASTRVGDGQRRAFELAAQQEPALCVHHLSPHNCLGSSAQQAAPGVMARKTKQEHRTGEERSESAATVAGDAGSTRRTLRRGAGAGEDASSQWLRRATPVS